MVEKEFYSGRRGFLRRGRAKRYRQEEEEEEEEAVFIRGVNTNEDSPNAQHAPHRPVQDTGAMSA